MEIIALTKVHIEIQFNFSTINDVYARPHAFTGGEGKQTQHTHAHAHTHAL